MNKLLVQLVLVISSVILFTGCTTGGSETDAVETDVFFGPLPKGLPVFVEIIEPYFNTSKADETAIALFSYKPKTSANVPASEKEVFSTDSNVFVTLNTIEDTLGRSEFTLLVKNDSVYLVNHLSNEIRLLNHFTTKVCEIIPTERVIESVIENADPLLEERVLTVLHAELVYVMTEETNSDCNGDGKRRFYALPLDHQLEVSVDEDGELNNLELVMESLARSKLIFGWKPDPDNAGKDRLEYAYLGYGVEEKKLKLFDKNKEVIWSQNRVIQSLVETELNPGISSTDYFFHIEALENYQYLVQLGWDVFVVDAGLDLINKPFNQIDKVLADRTVQLSSEKFIANSEYLARTEVAAKTVFDDENLFIIDNAKIYHLLYQANVPARNPSKITSVVNQNLSSIDGKEHMLRHSFSQFDLKTCDNSDLPCLAAQDVSAQAWQFFTRCEDQDDCSAVTEVNDYCETFEERLQTQPNEPLCSASNYLHISELNDASNDATLLAYMQYDKYTQHLDLTLHNDLLYVTAKMDQKDILLSYDYNIDFTAPKLLREHVLFGKSATLAGMDAYFVNDSLFLTALQRGASRSHECYKNYQKVICDPSDMITTGSGGFCTGKDLLDGKCTNQFREYESKALFCSASQLADLSCSDANLSQLNDLAIETENLNINEDAKWLKLYDYKSSSELMYLLIGDNALALDNNQLDEGKLYSPSLYDFDSTIMQKGNLLTSLQGPIEQVVGGWLSKGPIEEVVDKGLESGVSEVFGRMNVISEEVKQYRGTKGLTESALSTYLLELTLKDETSVRPDIMAPKVAERLFERPSIVIN